MIPKPVLRTILTAKKEQFKMTSIQTGIRDKLCAYLTIRSVIEARAADLTKTGSVCCCISKPNIRWTSIKAVRKSEISEFCVPKYVAN